MKALHPWIKILSCLAAYEGAGSIKRPTILLAGAPRRQNNARKEVLPIAEESNLNAMPSAYEKGVIEDTLRQCKWHRGRAAEVLGINRKTLFSKIAKHGLNGSQKRNSVGIRPRA